MTIDEIAARLDDLAVEHELPELEHLGEEIGKYADQINGTAPPCSNPRHDRAAHLMERLLEEFAMLDPEAVMRTLDRTRYAADQRAYQNQASSAMLRYTPVNSTALFKYISGV